jgi:hypothetical protein
MTPYNLVLLYQVCPLSPRVRVIPDIDENTTPMNNGPKILSRFRESIGVIMAVTEENLDFVNVDLNE